MWWLERESLIRKPFTVDEKKVLPFTHLFMRSLIDCVGTLKRNSEDLLKYKVYFENLITMWFEYLEQDVYWPPFDGVTELTEVPYKDKAEIISKLLDNMTHVNYRESIADDFGELLLSGPLFKLLDEKVLPLAD